MIKYTIKFKLQFTKILQLSSQYNFRVTNNINHYLYSQIIKSTPSKILKESSQIIQPQQKKLLSQLTDNQISTIDLKNFSIKVHQYLKIKAKDPKVDNQLIWQKVQFQFLKRLQITTDPQKIRSYSKIIYSLTKSKSQMSNLNYQNKFGIMLPFASHQSFTMIVMSVSRMGPFSRQFGYIVAKLYTKRKQQFNIREKVQLNYVITKNGFEVDPQLINSIQLMNLNQIALMLRSYDQSNCITEQILKKAEKHIIPRKNQMNILDLADFIKIYYKYSYLSQKMHKLITQMYNLLKRNVDYVIFENIWQYIPQTLNKGLLQVKFTNEVIKTMKILKKHEKFPDYSWKAIQRSFQRIQNLQIRVELQKIK